MIGTHGISMLDMSLTKLMDWDIETLDKKPTEKLGFVFMKPYKPAIMDIAEQLLKRQGDFILFQNS